MGKVCLPRNDLILLYSRCSRMEEEASLKRKHPQGEEVFVGAKRSKVEESISAEERPEVLLPPEIWFHVFSLLPEQTLLSTVGCVCHEWYVYLPSLNT